MSAQDVENFLKALSSVKEKYICGFCSELCRNPVTLSKCFHIICAEHFDGLKTCPNCNTSLDGCTIYSDDGGKLASCIESAKEMDNIFEGYKNTATINKSVSAASMKTSKKKSAKKAISATNVAPEPETTKKAVLSDKTNQKTEVNKSNANISLLSSVSRIDKGLEKKNNKGETTLHMACRLNKLDKVTELLDQGANTNTKDNAGWTPLHEAVQNGRIDLVRLLLQYNTLINVPGQSNETPLHEAVRYNHKNIVELLVKHGADINARNCKGETPFQLASTELKSILLSASDKIIQTQSVNITHMSALYSELEFDDIRVYCVSEFRTVFNKLKALAKSHSNLHIEAKLTKKVTHIIVDTEDNGVCQSSLDVLQGIVNSIWILSTNWVTKSNEDMLEPFQTYEVTGIGTTTYQGPKNSRYNKYKQLPGIFDGCYFYFHNFVGKYEITKKIVVTRAILTKLITNAGGVFLRRAPNPEAIPEEEKVVPYHAKKGGKLVNCSHYIIFKDMYEPMYNMQHLKALPVGWLIECIEKYELCEPW